MRKIGLLSDTHGWIDPALMHHFRACDEVWHAGDIGDPAALDTLIAFKPLRAVYGNIDGNNVRSRLSETLHFACEEVKVCITHIGGRPGAYKPGIARTLAQHQPDLFICGHSHILVVQMDKPLRCLHMNPGAAGKQGFHTVRTALRFDIEGKDIKNLQVIELGKRA